MKYIVENVKDFNVDHIFDCGQCFRWKKQENGSYTGVAKGKIANMAVVDGNLIIDNCTEDDYEEVWKDYLDMDTDYGEIKRRLMKNDPIIKGAIEHGTGIRILKQDLWESIVSFIISQNNHIPRIKRCIASVADGFGEKVGTYMGEDFYSLPDPEKLGSLSVSDLSEIKLGYRAKYLIDMSRQVQKYGLPKDYDELVELTGVGPKVANCVCLFGLGQTGSFPIDIWVKRVMSNLYGLPENDMKLIKQFAEAKFGNLGGYAQQYLFYSVRF